jgi:hypothetical protein
MNACNSSYLRDGNKRIKECHPKLALAKLKTLSEKQAEAKGTGGMA